jgi:hypothetical protein
LAQKPQIANNKEIQGKTSMNECVCVPSCGTCIVFPLEKHCKSRIASQELQKSLLDSLDKISRGASKMIERMLSLV